MTKAKTMRPVLAACAASAICVAGLLASPVQPARANTYSNLVNAQSQHAASVQREAHLKQQLAGASTELADKIMQLDDQLMKSRILNPQTGTVLVKYAEPGEVTAAGKPLYKIADTDLLYLRAYVTADQLSHLKLGQSLKVFADYGNDRREYPGTITWISDKSEFTPKGIQTKDERANLVYAIKIAVRNDGYLKIGQYGEIKYE